HLLLFHAGSALAPVVLIRDVIAVVLGSVVAGKVLASVTTAVVLPALGYAGYKAPSVDNNNPAYKTVHSVPEGGPEIVLLLTTIGAVLLFSTRRPSESKA